MTAHSALHVVFKIGGSEYVLAAADVLQMESWTGATRVPGSPPFVAGIVQLRGKVIPVVDLRTRFGLPAIEATPDTRIVVGQHRDRVVGLLVESAREVIQVPAEALKPPPRLMGNDAAGFVRAVAQVGTRLVMLIDLAKVIGEEQLYVE